MLMLSKQGTINTFKPRPTDCLITWVNKVNDCQRDLTFHTTAVLNSGFSFFKVHTFVSSNFQGMHLSHTRAGDSSLSTTSIYVVIGALIKFLFSVNTCV